MSEENNLDDFFANKDKTKKKSTKSTNKPSDIEQSAKSVAKVKKASKTKRKDEETSQTTKKVVEEDDEWKEYEEEAEKDYSNLKIINLNKKNGVDQDSQGNPSGDEEVGDKKESHGPWKPVAAPVSIPDPEPEEAVQVVTEVPKTGKYVPPAARQNRPAPAQVQDKPSSGKYVPPALRQSAMSSSSSTKLSMKVKAKKVAPDVKNVEDFPSLSAAAIIEQGQGKVTQDFEKVKGGAKQVANPLNTSSKISLNNKFGALEDGDS